VRDDDGGGGGGGGSGGGSGGVSKARDRRIFCSGPERPRGGIQTLLNSHVAWLVLQLNSVLVPGVLCSKPELPCAGSEYAILAISSSQHLRTCSHISHS